VKANRTIATSKQPIISARVRLSIDFSMKVAGRKIVVSIFTSLKAGPKLIDSRLDIAGQLQRVASGLFFDDQHDPRTIIDNGVADGRSKAIGHPRDIAYPELARHRRSL
jgi:hypothetical protein